MKLAVIDCGTNTFNLIIMKVKKDGSRRTIFHTRIPVKLGEKSINKKLISPAAINRGLEAFRRFREALFEHEVDHVRAFATSAIRDATNGREFIDLVRKETLIGITPIDGALEAELIYKGVREAVKMGPHRSLIMDVGGGSTEFIIADHEQIYWKDSFNIGVARLLEQFKPSDPITEMETARINAHLTTELKPLFRALKSFPPKDAVGSSGAFESLLELIHVHLNGERFSEEKTEYAISRKNYLKISQMLRKSTLQERLGLEGLVPMRVDMIVLFCLKVDLIFGMLGFNKIRVSTYSLKEGAAFDYLAGKLK